MSRAGKALKAVLERHGISQNQLAVAMKVSRANVSRWVNETRDPIGDAVYEIHKGLQSIDPAAAEDFVMKYLYDED
ncbi:MAG: helix-turn-helix transcriptional regulator [Leptolyngbya sp. SIO4C1]|nr:helix-turn-helix transcriptional regulator [Leptolyngbya sp. SIO4C1]